MSVAVSRQIDHLVITVRDLDAAAAEFGALGFTVTPRAEHPWGTSNRLVQFQDQSFLEILTLDRPHLLFEHNHSISPAMFSFGAYTRDFLARGHQGLSMCAFTSTDSRADAKRFATAGFGNYSPFDFGRKATLPDGQQVNVGFSLAFAPLPDEPNIVLFTCHNRYPENFWKPAFQEHANGAVGLGTVTLDVKLGHDPSRVAQSIATVAEGAAELLGHGLNVQCGANHRIFAGSHNDHSGPLPRLAHFSVRGTGRGTSDSVSIAGTTLRFD